MFKAEATTISIFGLRLLKVCSCSNPPKRILCKPVEIKTAKTNAGPVVVPHGHAFLTQLFSLIVMRVTL